MQLFSVATASNSDQSAEAYLGLVLVKTFFPVQKPARIAVLTVNGNFTPIFMFERLLCTGTKID